MGGHRRFRQDRNLKAPDRLIHHVHTTVPVAIGLAPIASMALNGVRHAVYHSGLLAGGLEPMSESMVWSLALVPKSILHDPRRKVVGYTLRGVSPTGRFRLGLPATAIEQWAATLPPCELQEAAFQDGRVDGDVSLGAFIL